jgi:glycosyltransferase involved in cell wall biosynthesis
LISVVIPSYNRAAQIANAIESVRSQTHQNLEILVVDDGSTDETMSVLNALSPPESRLRILSHPRNLGAQAARNTGIRAATGSWIAFLDSDDTYLPDSLEKRLELAIREGNSAVHSECVAARANGEVKLYGTPPMRGNIRRAVLAHPGPTFPGLMVRISDIASIGYLDESLSAYQEWDTAIRLSQRARFSFLAEPTFRYNLGDGSTISANFAVSAKGYERVVRKHAKEMLRTGGLPVLAAHLREMARQRGLARELGTAWSRLLTSIVVWPIAIGSDLRIAKGLLVRREPTSPDDSDARHSR